MAQKLFLLLIVFAVFAMMVQAETVAKKTVVTTETLRQAAFEEKDPSFEFPARKERYFYNGVSDGDSVALTFDDGPNLQWTRSILQVLKEKKVPATFFLLGDNVRQNPEIVKEIIEAGCEVGNHSYDHSNMGKLGEEKVKEQITKTQDEIKNACGVEPKVMRAPYGVASATVAKVAYQMRLDMFFWSLDTDDWRKTVTAENMVEKVLKDIKPGSIILMHDKSQKQVDALKAIIDPIRAKGLRFVTCSDIAAQVRAKKHLNEQKKEQTAKQPTNSKNKSNVKSQKEKTK